MSKVHVWGITVLLITTLSAGTWVWKRYGPSDPHSYQLEATVFPLAETLHKGTSGCDLEVRHYKQIGNELQFQLYASQGGLSPYSVEITQNKKTHRFQNVPHRPGTWLTLNNLSLTDGPATIRIQSNAQSGCETTAAFAFKSANKDEIVAQNQWIRHGSDDIWLDVRPVQKNGRLYLKDFANYQDGRTRVYLIDGTVVGGLDEGLEVRPGYLYTILARWIDAPYSEWWNHLRYRTVRQQCLWIAPSSAPSPETTTHLRRIGIPAWFSPSPSFNVHFDTSFPEFEPIPGKLAMQYRLNNFVPAQNYLKRGITHLPRWEEDIPRHKQHWTEPPGFFADRDENWFSSLSKEEVEAYADQVGGLGVYIYDFEFWNRDYAPAVKERLIWYSARIRKNHPSIKLFDYWGGSAVHNTNFQRGTSIDPAHFLKDYQSPTPTNSNFKPLANGETLGKYLNGNLIDVYPKIVFGDDPSGVTPNNYLILAALHAARINQLFSYQKNNQTIWYAWNRHLPMHQDPAVPWHVKTANPDGDLFFNQLEMMPASQALGISLFSLVTADGYYLWHDNQPLGKGSNNYNLDLNHTGWGWEWYPADGRTGYEAFQQTHHSPESPKYWDYPTEYFALGNWMAKQVEDILVGGKKQDLAYQLAGTWREPKPEQAVLSAMRKEPFVTAVVKGNQIAVLAIDSFQKPNQSRSVTIKLPNGQQVAIQLYGNWPALYRGTL
ncbi:hypothetical protein HNQ92_001473 [Rhabdobacter roseus]|uniref:Uncharacterized protein n=1 Tax=Rhabdobacter roseus TaxID=1655419 RepID=A0A840TNL4_9BACT|nr:hypothetical protein [Rhabdobacter roseus]MBB5283347.1 hypothetical protein [Rhabdobacter roseus]